MNGYRLPVSRNSAGNNTNLSLGARWSFQDLDVPAVLAQALDENGAAGLSELIGGQTSHPIGFGIQEVVRMFYRVRKFGITGSFTGGVADRVSRPWTGVPGTAEITKRARTLVELGLHETEVLSGFEYNLKISPVGFLSAGLVYPLLVGSVIGGTARTNGAGLDPVGAFSIYGKSCTVYGTLGVPGDMTVTEDTLW